MGEADIAILLGGGKYVRPLIPAVVDDFYHKLLQYDVTANVFAARSSGYEGHVDAVPTENSPQMHYRKLVTATWDWCGMQADGPDFARLPAEALYRLEQDGILGVFGQGWVGWLVQTTWKCIKAVTLCSFRHAGSDRTKCLSIEYVHLSAAVGHLQNLLNEAILNHPRLKSERKMALVKAIGKVMWIQNDLFARWQSRDGEGRPPDHPKRVESEGYLHGLNVLARAENDAAPDTPVDEASGAFEGLSMARTSPGQPPY